MDDTELRLYAAEAFRQMDQVHPSIEQVAEFAGGELSGSDRDEVERHLIECDQCRGRLEEYRQFVADCEQPPDEETSAGLSEEWEGLRRRIWRHRILRAAPKWAGFGGVTIAVAAKWGGIAAVVIALAGSSWFVIRTLNPSPAKLLAQAYHEQRTSEYRLAGAQYSEVRRQRGAQSVFDVPATLLNAQSKLKDQLKAKPDDPDLLRLKGEAEMMSNQPAAAVQTLQMARDLRADDPHILADLGAAYAFRGDFEKDYGDYVTASEYLGHSVQLDAASREARFNLALVLEKMKLKDQAIEQWKLYLQLDGTSDWAKEAHQHLTDLQAELDRREDALHQVVYDPAQFLAQVASGGRVDAEAYLRDVVITKWLPLAASDGPAREATILLGRILKAEHGDSWLADMVDSLRPGMLRGLQDLAAARSSNQQGVDLGASLGHARQALESFRLAGSRPGSIWATFEQIASLHALMRHDECVQLADVLMQDLEPHQYLWVRIELSSEYGIWALRKGELGEAAVRLREAKLLANRAGFSGAELRAAVMYLDCLGHIGLPSEMFAGAEQCLGTFWSGAHPALRFQQVTGKLLDITARDKVYTAWFLAGAGVWAADATSNPYVEAPARANLAAASQAIELDAMARDNMEIADRLFLGIPVAYRLQPQISLANVDLARADPDSALSRLRELGSNLPSGLILVGSQYYAALGEAYRQKEQLAAALNAFRKSIDLGRQRLASLSSEPEKAGALRTIGPGYKGLIEAMLAGGGTAEDALSEWQSFRSLDAGDTSDDIPHYEGPVFSFAELPNGFAGWLRQGDQVTLRRLDVPKAKLTNIITRFRRECSDPASDQTKLREDAEQLYDWILGPFASPLAEENGGLVLELDGVLSAVPVQALVSKDGRYLAESLSVMFSSGPASARQIPAPGTDASALIVADPTVTGSTGERFPPLPDSRSEALAVRTAFPASRVLEGAQATLKMFSKYASSADVIHFAGHGYANAEGGALLFAPSGPGADYELLRSLDLRRQDWSRCRLAVLSACAAASGETKGPHNPESLVRAFLKAGVSTVLASIWNADSAATCELMRTFYAALAQGASPAASLQIAQRSVRKRAGWEHPYYWAGFQLYGSA